MNLIVTGSAFDFLQIILEVMVFSPESRRDPPIPNNYSE